MLEYQLEINRVSAFEGALELHQHDVLSAALEHDLTACGDLETSGTVLHPHEIPIDHRFVKLGHVCRRRMHGDQSVVSVRVIDDPEIDYADGRSGVGMRNGVGDLDREFWFCVDRSVSG